MGIWLTSSLCSEGMWGAYVSETMCVFAMNLRCRLRKIPSATEGKYTCIADTYTSGQVRSGPLWLHTISCTLRYWETVPLHSIVILGHFCVLSYRRKGREGDSFVVWQRNKRRIQILKAKDYLIPLFMLGYSAWVQWRFTKHSTIHWGEVCIVVWFKGLDCALK